MLWHVTFYFPYSRGIGESKKMVGANCRIGASAEADRAQSPPRYTDQ
jgi:hypothetical protein